MKKIHTCSAIPRNVTFACYIFRSIFLANKIVNTKKRLKLKGKRSCIMAQQVGPAEDCNWSYSGSNTNVPTIQVSHFYSKIEKSNQLIMGPCQREAILQGQQS